MQSTLPRSIAFFCNCFVLLVATLTTTSLITTNKAFAQGPGSGELSFQPSDATTTDNQNQSNLQALLLQTQVDASISGLIAEVSYQQTFENQSQDWQEAIYSFPLPENAAVYHMEILVGERRIVASVKEKAEAQRIYTQARTEGRVAALTEQQRPNFFTQRVANIPPLTKIVISIQYLQQLEYESGKFAFSLPTTFTPRFNPGIPLRQLEENPNQDFIANIGGWGNSGQTHRATDQVPDGLDISPPMIYAEELARINRLSNHQYANPLNITIDLDPGLALARLESRYHDIDIQQPATNSGTGTGSNPSRKYEISLTKGTEAMDRDFLLEWQPISSEAPQVALFEQQLGENMYHLAMIMPPQVIQNGATLPREVTLIIDTSGSMQGTSIAAAKESLQMAVNRLSVTDYFNIIEFNTDFTTLFRSPQPASPQNLNRANRFVSGLRATGGTNMIPALDHALLNPSNQELLQQVVFLTDGAIGNEQGLLTLLHNKLGSARLFTLGIGSAPNSYLMTQMAEFGRGSHSFIRNQADVQQTMADLFLKLESPLMSDLRLSWPMEVEQFPSLIPDLYAGEPLIVVAKSAIQTNSSSAQIELRGETQNTPWSRSLELHQNSAQASSTSPSDGSSSDNQASDSNNQTRGLSTIWARAKIKQLTAGSARGISEEQIRSEVLPLALEHQLVSKYTSLIAVEEQISRPELAQLETSAVPNLYPLGQTAWPKTATPMQLFLAISLLSMLLFGVLVFFGSNRPAPAEETDNNLENTPQTDR